MNTSVAHAHAWDLFAHMRYVAHPTPDVFLYSTMIRACARSSVSPSCEPERALDLFTEMTVDNQIPPTSSAYNAVILACARSGRVEYVNEAFRLAKEMLDAHRDARGESLFAPELRLFCALLEGAKRVGDLPRARWILAEMVNDSLRSGDASDHVKVDPERAIHDAAMVHIFHAYAAYKPPFERSMAAIVEHPAESVAVGQTESGEGEQTSQEQSRAAEEQKTAITTDGDEAFSRLPPQSHAEVVYEARVLFSRILDDHRRNLQLIREGSQERDGIFGYVQLKPKLLNAYLSVHYRHAPLEDWIKLYRTLHPGLGVPRAAMTYIEVLERCARGRSEERNVTLPLAEEVWAELKTLEDRWRTRTSDQTGLNARLVERAYVAMIRILAK